MDWCIQSFTLTQAAITWAAQFCTMGGGEDMPSILIYLNVRHKTTDSRDYDWLAVPTQYALREDLLLVCL